MTARQPRNGKRHLRHATLHYTTQCIDDALHVCIKLLQLPLLLQSTCVCVFLHVVRCPYCQWHWQLLFMLCKMQSSLIHWFIQTLKLAGWFTYWNTSISRSCAFSVLARQPNFQGGTARSCRRERCLIFLLTRWEDICSDNEHTLFIHPDAQHIFEKGKEKQSLHYQIQALAVAIAKMYKMSSV